MIAASPQDRQEYWRVMRELSAVLQKIGFF
jgi:hypothetical protein